MGIIDAYQVTWRIIFAKKQRKKDLQSSQLLLWNTILYRVENLMDEHYDLDDARERSSLIQNNTYLF
jgi:hypothetical protein